MILTLAVSGYRSLRKIIIPLDKLTIITGANGTGKSSIYKSIRLLADVAQGNVVRSLALEGGIPSTLWAGPEKFSRSMKSGQHPIEGTVRREPVSLKLGFASEDYGYAIDLGLPKSDGRSMFNLDPEIKSEAMWIGEVLKRHNVIASRAGPGVQVMQENGARQHVLTALPSFDSMMTHAGDPKQASEILLLRERMRNWRFYDHFRTDQASKARMPQVGTRTVSLASDGSDLAAAVQTIKEIGDPEAFDDAIEDAFPGSSIKVDVKDNMFEVVMQQKGLLRPLRTSELSDGTLRYLLLVAALMTPRPPPLLVLNEPETSLHPSLLPALARLIKSVAQTTQIIVVSHAGSFVDELAMAPNSANYELKKQLGETIISDVPDQSWNWQKR
jgi:predicted ATPase